MTCDKIDVLMYRGMAFSALRKGMRNEFREEDWDGEVEVCVGWGGVENSCEQWRQSKLQRLTC